MLARKAAVFNAAAYGTLGVVGWNFRANPFALTGRTPARLSDIQSNSTDGGGAALCAFQPVLSQLSSGDGGVLQPVDARTLTPMKTWGAPESYANDAQSTYLCSSLWVLLVATVLMLHMW